MPNFLVIGLGRFGTSVAMALSQEKCHVLALDSDMNRVQELASELPRVARCDGRDLESLRAVGAHQYRVGVVAIQNLEASILITLNLKQLGVATVVAKAASRDHGLALSRCGADRVVYPLRDMGVRTAHNLVSARVVDYVEVTPGVGMLEVAAPATMVGKSLADLALPGRLGIQVVAIHRGNRVTAGPGANETIRSGDVLVLIGRTEGIRAMEEEL